MQWHAADEVVLKSLSSAMSEVGKAPSPRGLAARDVVLAGRTRSPSTGVVTYFLGDASQHHNSIVVYKMNYYQHGVEHTSYFSEFRGYFSPYASKFKQTKGPNSTLSTLYSNKR